jgi:hypothetical protein
MAQVFDDGSSLSASPTHLATYDDADREGILLLGVNSNTMVRVSNTAHVDIDIVNDFDKQRHKHQNFGRKKFLGLNFAEIHIQFTIMPDEESNFYSQVVPLLRPRGKNAASPALTISNYQVNRWGISQVNVLKARIGPPSSRSGRLIHLELEEWTIAPTEPKPSEAGVEQFDPYKAGNDAGTALNTRNNT